ncbi:hypothetical protein C9374_013375 [Naegleria lovaniensis]|uniref:Beta-adaptin appendage C-terminal subdomain domain-containing protein n=1 Tax=Naegleria lovaniensis TaxID=51637 RepID=A0AA88GZ52_NAELO|nr:uncharacterized protein C9374_013375 [Naegleria lovaniensis]KAG2391890.1 hypothetical protein C9374_013375 [Naegleria lovaniensis]
MFRLLQACFGGSDKKSRRNHDMDDQEIETDEFMEMNHQHPIGINHDDHHHMETIQSYANSSPNQQQTNNNNSQAYYYIKDKHSTMMTSPNYVPSPTHMDDISNCFNLSPIKLNQNVKEYTTDEYKQLWKQFGDGHVTLEYSIIFHHDSSNTPPPCEEFKSYLDHTLESNFIYTLASGVNHHVITFYNYCESLNNITYLIESQVNYDTRLAKVRIKYSSNSELTNFVNHFEKITASYFTRIK